MVSRWNVDSSGCNAKGVDVGGELEGKGLGWIESERSAGSIWDNNGNFLNVGGMPSLSRRANSQCWMTVPVHHFAWVMDAVTIDPGELEAMEQPPDGSGTSQWQ